MKHFYNLLLIFPLFVAISLSNSMIVNSADYVSMGTISEQSQYTIDTPYEYPVHLGMEEDIDRLIIDVQSWDLCDHLCKNLIIKLKDYDVFIAKWVASTHTYKKRAAFTLIAASVIHNKSVTNDTLDDYLHIIREYSDSEHEHVKKAVSWALREIGKKDFTYNEKAINLAHEIKESGNKTKAWIAKDALKELETLVKVEGRDRLISTNTQMGKE